MTRHFRAATNPKDWSFEFQGVDDLEGFEPFPFTIWRPKRKKRARREHLLHLALARWPGDVGGLLGGGIRHQWVTFAGNQSGDLRGVCQAADSDVIRPVSVEAKMLKSLPAKQVAAAWLQAARGLREFVTQEYSYELAGDGESRVLPPTLRFDAEDRSRLVLAMVYGTEDNKPAAKTGVLSQAVNLLHEKLEELKQHKIRAALGEGTLDLRAVHVARFVDPSRPGLLGYAVENHEAQHLDLSAES